MGWSGSKAALVNSNVTGGVGGGNVSVGGTAVLVGCKGVSIGTGVSEGGSDVSVGSSGVRVGEGVGVGAGAQLPMIKATREVVMALWNSLFITQSFCDR